MRPLLCDWCKTEIDEREPHHLVKINNDNELDCCQTCIKGIRPKPKVGRPKKQKSLASPMDKVTIADPVAACEAK
jgi:hypothetical protein